MKLLDKLTEYLAPPARVGGAASPGDLATIIAQFQAERPDDWEALKLCPLQHGLDAMIAKLKG